MWIVLLVLGIYIVVWIVGMALYGRMDGKAKEILYGKPPK